MPRRLTPLVNDNFYHVYNHGIDLRDTFTSKREFEHFQLAAWFYQPKIVTIKLSHYLNLSTDQRLNIKKDFNRQTKAIKIHTYCLMSNHYHMLIEQIVENGISKFISQLQNSYTKYFNIKHERKGALFLSAFHAKHISTEEQFLHVSRYIHLNPYTAHIFNNLDQLKVYPYTSCPEYFNLNSTYAITSIEKLKLLFKSHSEHWRFLVDQADYQRQLSHIEHLLD